MKLRYETGFNLWDGLAIRKMLSIEKNMYVTFIIVNMMQTKLQNVLNYTSSSKLCTSITLTDFSLGGKTYHIGCSTEKNDVNHSLIRWPVLAVDTTLTTVQVRA